MNSKNIIKILIAGIYITTTMMVAGCGDDPNMSKTGDRNTPQQQLPGNHSSINNSSTNNGSSTDNNSSDDVNNNTENNTQNNNNNSVDNNASDNNASENNSNSNENNSAVDSEQLLCESTNGVWNDDTCDCSEHPDGSFFEYRPSEGCQLPSSATIIGEAATKDLSGLIENFGEGEGPYYIIDRPGAIDGVLGPYDSVDEIINYLSDNGWTSVLESLGACIGDIGSEDPGLTCADEDLFDEAGCFVYAPESYDRISAVMDWNNELEMTSYTEQEIDDARALEATIQQKFIDYRHGISVTFRRTNSRWNVVSVDISENSCGA